MANLREKLIFSCKLVAAILAIGILLLVAGRDIFPLIPPWKLLLYAGAGALVFLAIVCLHAVSMASWNQVALNRGATDPAWLSLGGEPPGLQALRAASESDEAFKKWTPLVDESDQSGIQN